MDGNAEHIVKAIDAAAHDDEADNEQKTINHSLRALKGMGAIPARVQGMPWYAVSIDPSRHWDTASGEMPVAIRAETGEGMVDTMVNRTVVLCGDNVGYWRVNLVNGQADLTIPVNTFADSGQGQLFVLDASEPQRQGATPTFTWS